MTRVAEILSEARELLEAAHLGLTIMKQDRTKVKVGFRNVAVFGKMVTFCTNNLRDKVEGFEEWDRSAKEKYFDTDVARAMSDARNQIEKQARSPISATLHIKNFSSQDLARFPKPSNAISFFMGDRFGGSGWMLQLQNGDRIPLYIDLPTEIGESKMVLSTKGNSLDLIPASEEYLNALQNYLEELSDFVRAATEGPAE